MTRLRIGWVEQHLTKESLGCCGIAFGREQEIDGLPDGIHGPVQISVLPFDPDVGFIDAIASIGWLQVSAAALVQFWPVDLDPPPDATGVDEQTTFERHLGHVRKGDRKPQVPPHAPENDIARIVTPFEGIRRGDGHVSPYQILVPVFATIPVRRLYVAMHDTGSMGGSQDVRDLYGVFQHIVQTKPSASDQLVDCLPLNVFHGDEIDFAAGVDLVNGNDVGMVQG
jgi:hypothetical protein